MTIFVSIASYRDSELVPTVLDALAKANRPERLRFGICWQHGEDDDITPLLDHPQITILDVNWRDTGGACWARAECMKMYGGEDHFLQLDSHHRFVPGWDEISLHQLRQAPSDKPVLSAYLPVYELDEPPNPHADPLILTSFEIGEDSIPRVTPVPIPGWRDKDRPVRARFLSGHFLLAAGSFVEEIPYDPELYFIGEEISLSVRAFTWGWDLFHPTRVVMWHNYGGHYRRKHWDDHHDGAEVSTSWTARDKLSRMTARGMLLRNAVGPLRLGTRRTVADFEAYAGIDFRARTVSEEARDGVEPKAWAAPAMAAAPA
jgi:hypothetical protein